jgi:hypothetical protein
MDTSKATKQSVLNQLDSSALTKSGFACDFDLDADIPLSIRSKDNSHHFFVLERKPSPLSPEKPWEVSESPGPIFRGAETTRFERAEDGIRYLTDWHRRVVEELTQSNLSKRNQTPSP